MTPEPGEFKKGFDDDDPYWSVDGEMELNWVGEDEKESLKTQIYEWVYDMLKYLVHLLSCTDVICSNCCCAAINVSWETIEYMWRAIVSWRRIGWEGGSRV